MTITKHTLLATKVGGDYIAVPIKSGGGNTSIDLAVVKFFLDQNGDSWMVQNAFLENHVWNRTDDEKHAFAVQFVTNGDPPGIFFWRTVPGTNPIGPFFASGGWELIQSFDENGNSTISGSLTAANIPSDLDVQLTGIWDEITGAHQALDELSQII